MSSQFPGDTGLPEDAPLAAVTRGALVESVHRGRLVVCDPDGNVLEAVGDPEAYIYARSSAKPFQALPLVHSGAADAFGLTDRELGVVCASHNAEEPHLAAVRSILEKAGLTEDDLQSGAHLPLYEPEADKLIRSGRAKAGTPQLSLATSTSSSRRPQTSAMRPRMRRWSGWAGSR